MAKSLLFVETGSTTSDRKFVSIIFFRPELHKILKYHQKSTKETKVTKNHSHRIHPRYEPVSPTLHPGSPLDLLTIPPSQMFGNSIAPGVADAYGGDQAFQQQLRVMEREISKRSLAVVVKWSWDKCRVEHFAIF